MSIATTMFDLTGRTALITGGASGIGLAIAKALAQHGAKVAVGSRTMDKVQAAAEELKSFYAGNQRGSQPGNEGGNEGGDKRGAMGVALDVTDPASIEAAVEQTVATLGGIDILVNSAGVMLRKPTFDLDAADFNRLYDTHVAGSLRCCQAAGRRFREQGSGCIINLASISSFVDLVEVTSYACAKNAILGLTRSLANEWAKHGIRTNAIAPGFVPTDINRKMIENTDRGRRILEHTPMGRFGSADEIAPAAVYLASSAGRFVNGHTIVVDGGYLASGIGDSVAPWAC